ncbi:MAG: peptide chain release factor N(5)-glutamine methyltransferase [Planctomycetota bacterium]
MTTPRGASGDAPRTLRDMAARGREFLERHGDAEARLDAELLVARAVGLDRLKLFLALDRPVDAEEVARARELLVRRAKGEPTAYILGEREFYRRPFVVDRRVLVPRPETEHVVDRAREYVRTRVYPSGGPRVLDVGTGSGCLAVTLALELPGANVVAVDVSAEALAVARENAERLGADVGFLEGDGLAPARELGGRAFDLVVSNPPYVDARERDELQKEVREHEPHVALFAPDGDPDHWVLRLAREAPALLAPGGLLLVELGYDQWERVGDAIENARVHKDLAGIPRVLEWAKPD